MIRNSKCNWFGPGAVFHHVGIAVSSLKAIEEEALEIFEDPTQKVAIAFLENGGCCIELVAPLTANSPVSSALTKRQKLLHLCFEVDDLDKALASAVIEGFKCIASPVPAVAFSGRRIAWVYSQDYGLMELLERYKSQA